MGDDAEDGPPSDAAPGRTTDGSSRIAVSRRAVLRSTATLGLGAIAIPPARGQQTTRRNVGLDADVDTSVATDRARDVIHEFDFDSIGKAVTGEFTDAAIDDLDGSDGVRYTESDERNADGALSTTGRLTDRSPGGDGGAGDARRFRAARQRLPWGIDRIDADVAHDEAETGSESVDVAVVDSGVVSDHEDLDANLGDGHAVVECTELADRASDCDDTYGPNDNPRDEPWDDDRDHGTHVAGVVGALVNSVGVVGVSPDVTIHSVKVMNECGLAYDSDLAAGLAHVVDRDWDVANVSLGSESASPLARDAVRYADDSDVLLVAAAGNGGRETLDYPARRDEVVAVTATTDDDSLAEFSNYGASTAVAAPGVNVRSTVYEDPRGPYEYFHGTSMAAPHAAGVLALLRADGYGTDEARAQLRETAEDVGLPADRQGNGLVDAPAALELDESGETPSG